MGCDGLVSALWGLAPPLSPGAAWALDGTHRLCSTRRTQAHKVTRRLKSGATGHDEGHERCMRSVTAGTRAPSVRTRRWIVSIGAQAHGAVLHTSRRKGSSHP